MVFGSSGTFRTIDVEEKLDKSELFRQAHTARIS